MICFNKNIALQSYSYNKDENNKLPVSLALAHFRFYSVNNNAQNTCSFIIFKHVLLVQIHISYRLSIQENRCNDCILITGILIISKF